MPLALTVRNLVLCVSASLCTLPYISDVDAANLGIVSEENKLLFICPILAKTCILQNWKKSIKYIHPTLETTTLHCIHLGNVSDKPSDCLDVWQSIFRYIHLKAWYQTYSWSAPAGKLHRVNVWHHISFSSFNEEKTNRECERIINK